MSYNFDLTIVWAWILGFAIFAYVVMDGFDLGIGILFPTFSPGDERDQAMNSIAPVWDGNETWLVLGGGGLMAAFPLAYAIILPATYPLVIAMLMGLIFRGVAFEFRWRHANHRAFWDIAFCAGSIVATLSQGMILGTILQGIKVANRAYAGGIIDWLTPFSVLTAFAMLVGYAMLGATWLVGKTSGRPHERARSLAMRLGILMLIVLAAVSAATPFLSIDYWHRWFTLPNVLFTAQVPLLILIFAGIFFWSLSKGRQRIPFFAALVMFALAYLGLGISIFPYVIPHSVTIWDAAAPRTSQLFMLVGTVLIIPMILTYTAWAYYVFRGKVDVGGYH